VTDTETERKTETRLTGKIIKISSNGYGFISSREVPFTRIFFHWTALKSDSMKFTELRAGMKVSFVASEIEGKGYRAIKIQVE